MLIWRMIRLRKHYLLCLALCLVLFNLYSQFSYQEQLQIATDKLLGVLARNRDVDAVVLPNQSTTLLSPHRPGQDHCMDFQGSGLFLLVMVISSPANLERRALIRSMFKEMRPQWEESFQAEKSRLGMSALNVTRVFQVLFLVGQSPKSGVSAEVRQEWDQHGDIIVDDLHESYLGLTVKTLRMLKWVLHSCPQASFVMKMDDDAFVNLPRVLSFLLPQTPSSRLVAGLIFRGAIPIRDPYSKWFTPMATYPLDEFPTYVSGVCYVLGMQAVQELFQESRHVSMFHMEDLFLTGFVATNRLHYKLQQPGKIEVAMNSFYGWRPVQWALDHVIIHEVSPDQFRCWTRLTGSKELGWTTRFWPIALLGTCNNEL